MDTAQETSWFNTINVCKIYSILNLQCDQFLIRIVKNMFMKGEEMFKIR